MNPINDKVKYEILSDLAVLLPNMPATERLCLAEWYAGRRSQLQMFQEEQGEWAAVTFPNQTLDGKLNHLIKEIDIEIRKDPSDIMEFADAMSLLLDAARISGHSADAIVNAAFTKLGINRDRTWGEQGTDGCFHHIK